MMRRLLTYALSLFAVAACSQLDETEVGSIGRVDEGAVRMSISAPRSVTSAQYDPMQCCCVKIYKYLDSGEGSDVRSRGLVRKYDSLDEMPEQIWLLAGDYAAVVEVGDKTVATTAGKCYAGEADFKVEAGIIGNIEVECKLLSTVVAVVFDETAQKKLPDNAYAMLAVDEEFNISRAQNGDVPSLRFEEDGEGYFMMPDGETTIAWFFHGESEELGTVERSGVIENVKPAVKYTVTFRYSKDPNGMLSFDVGIDESVDEVDDTIAFSPDPTIKGDEGFDITAEQLHTAGSYTYVISALAEISEISLFVDGQRHIVPLADSDEAVKVTRKDGKNYEVTLTDAFFAPLAGGAHEVKIYVADTDGGNGEHSTIFNTQGVLPIGSSYDLWYGTADFTAMVFGNNESIVIEYRDKSNGNWKALEAKHAGGNTYKAHTDDFTASTEYEYRLKTGSTVTGATLSVKTPDGEQLPNADFERWSQSGAAYYPYASGDKPFWDTGNPGATTLGESYNLTNKSTDKRPGSDGTYSAYMHSAYPNMIGIGKFAAGNIFVGKFAGTQGTNGLVDFGQPFNFTARPKAMKFWYKNHSGKIDKDGDYRDSNGNKVTGQNDLTHIFIALCKWDGPHRVDTRDTKTFFDPRTVEGMVGCGFFETRESCETWTEKRLDITYYSDERPNFLVVVFTCSAYGDYFTGSTDSWMYVDDVELVYR